MKINLGCGYNHIEGHVNVDVSSDVMPDVVWDLEKFPWPWDNDSADRIVAMHCLEHMGAEVNVWLGILKELYRVAKPDATIHIEVPHPRHDYFINDCTHVRPITPDGFILFDQETNIRAIESRSAASPLGLLNGIDFKLEKVNFSPAEPWRSRFEKGEIDQKTLEMEAKQKLNVCDQISIVLRVIKPQRGLEWLEKRGRNLEPKRSFNEPRT